jgi:hypothetical protein
MRLHRRCKAACWERDRLFAIPNSGLIVTASEGARSRHAPFEILLQHDVVSDNLRCVDTLRFQF